MSTRTPSLRVASRGGRESRRNWDAEAVTESQQSDPKKGQENKSYWSKAVQVAWQDTSRTKTLLELRAEELPVPLQPTVAEVAEVSWLFERKDPECPRELLKKMVEVLLSKAAVEAVTPSIVEYMELSEIGMGGTLVHLLDFVPTKPVFGTCWIQW